MKTKQVDRVLLAKLEGYTEGHASGLAQLKSEVKYVCEIDDVQEKQDYLNHLLELYERLIECNIELIKKTNEVVR